MKSLLVILMLVTSVNTYAVKILPQVIYNTDDRKEVFQEQPADVMSYIQKRTLAIIHNAKLFPQENGDILFMDRNYGRSLRLCKTEKFFEQPSLPTCTASIIGKNIALTAGHCMSESTCLSHRFIADYVMSDDLKAPEKTSQNKIFKCVKILYQSGDDNSDVAIIQLDRDFPETALQIADPLINKLELSDQLLVIGFPGGLPMKSSGLGPIRAITDTTITAELDTYGGNSGSPVFKKNSDVIEGILVRGEDDFILSANKQCFQSKVCNSTACQGEAIISARVIRQILSDISANKSHPNFSNLASPTP